jgi:uncharacterized protein
MKLKILLLTLAILSVTGCTQQPKEIKAIKDYKISEVPFNQVKINDNFWSQKMEINRTVTIPSSFKKCEETGRVANFVKAAKHEGHFGTEFPFDDTDLYKIIEGASYSLSVHPDPKLDHYVDSLITIIGNAQEPDGYLYTARTIDPEHPHPWSGKKRWVNVSKLSHELYCSGHLFEAAAAHYQATGKRNFLNIALKNADLLCQVFGPGKRDDAPGHEIVEMGLVKLYRITGKKKYLNLAKFFIDCRGKVRDPKETYSQDQKPVVEQTQAVGHAVRAGYLYSGVADVAALTGDSAYLKAIDKIWHNMVYDKYYITGGIGARHEGEAFGADYELPNLTAYNETCAAIANVFWNYRMFLLHGDAKYIDVLERTLYNGLISGVGLDGKTFFYPNPLECDMKYKFNQGGTITRQPWFDCSCCPTNMCRFMPSVPGYIYANTDDKVYVNLFIQSSSDIDVKGNKVAISQETNYPWEGDIRINVSPEKEGTFSVCLRVPGWAENQPVPGTLYHFQDTDNHQVAITVNGQPVKLNLRNGYAVLTREWEKGDQIDYRLPMDIRKVKANELVKADSGKIAIERGPIVYCLEGVDNPDIDQLAITDNTQFTAHFNRELLNGVEIISGNDPSADEQFTAIPYYAWNNRGADKMKVWVPIK